MLSFHGTLRNCGESKGSPLTRAVAARFRSHRGRPSFLPSKLKSMIPRKCVQPIFGSCLRDTWMCAVDDSVGYLSICNFLDSLSRISSRTSPFLSGKLKNTILKRLLGSTHIGNILFDFISIRVRARLD